MEITIIILVSLIWLFGVNMLIYRCIVKKAVRTFIIPYLEANGYSFEDKKFVGFFKTGDFKIKGFPFLPIMMNGYPFSNTYIYVYAKDKSTNDFLKITTKIKTLFFWVRKVEYSEDLKKS